MKKLLMLILIVLLLALGIFIALNGFEVSALEVLSYTGIQQKNAELDAKIQESSKLVEKDFKQATSTVQTSSKKLEQTKKEYEEMTTISGEGETGVTNQIERYEVETLWVKLGKYATTEGAIIRMDIVQGNTSETYNLKFTVNGSYISITDFIADIENDSTLGFKIEEFKMVPSESNTVLQATFVCKEIGIKEVSGKNNANFMKDPTIDTMNTTTNNMNTTNGTNNTSTMTSNTTNTSNNVTTNNTNTTTSNTNVSR